MNKIINSVCVCNIPFLSKREEISALIPCEHLVHRTCLNKVEHKCPFCYEVVKSTKNESELSKMIANGETEYHQMYIDMLSLRVPENYSQVNKFILFHRFPELLSFSLQGYLQPRISDIQKLAFQFLAANNIYMQIRGNIIDSSQRIVFIATHTNPLDAFVMFALTQCGVVASKQMFASVPTLQYIIAKTNFLIMDRSVKGKTIDKMTNYLKNHHRRLLVFPEGMLSHHHCINRFRSGGFHTGYPIQPVVLKYRNNVYGKDIMSYFARATSQDKMVVTATFLDVEYPPFTNQRIEKIRQKMAEESGSVLSRVSNRMIKD